MKPLIKPIAVCVALGAAINAIAQTVVVNPGQSWLGT
jgi:hypothetical protein